MVLRTWIRIAKAIYGQMARACPSENIADMCSPSRLRFETEQLLGNPKALNELELI